jgi:cytochrome c oxidase subunit 2
MARFPKFRTPILTVALMALLLAVLSACASPQNTFDPKSDAADSILTIYIIVIVVASIVGFAVLAAMVWLMIKFRAKPGIAAKQIHGNTKLEIAWTIAPILVLLIIAFPTMFWIAGSAEEPEADVLHVTATGHQWWFEFTYPGLGPDGGDLITANELVIPVGRDIKVTLHSDDVVHSFWVPQLVGKTDMIPGRTNVLETFKAYEPGLYYGQCAEFCGAAHALMRFRVNVRTNADFLSWADAHNTGVAAPEPGTAAARGALGFATCSGCHAISGTNFTTGRIGPDLSLFGERSTIAAGILDNTDENLRAWIGDVRSIKPIPEGARFMPTFNDGTLDDGQIADIAAYLNSLTAE